MNVFSIQKYIQEDFKIYCGLQFMALKDETKHQFENPSQNAPRSLWLICYRFSVAKGPIANNQLLKLISKLNSIWRPTI